MVLEQIYTSNFLQLFANRTAGGIVRGRWVAATGGIVLEKKQSGKEKKQQARLNMEKLSNKFI